MNKTSTFFLEIFVFQYDCFLPSFNANLLNFISWATLWRVKFVQNWTPALSFGYNIKYLWATIPAGYCKVADTGQTDGHLVPIVLCSRRVAKREKCLGISRCDFNKWTSENFSGCNCNCFPSEEEGKSSFSCEKVSCASCRIYCFTIALLFNIAHTYTLLIYLGCFLC